MNKEITSDTRFFRAGVGTVIYNEKQEVAMFKRAKFPIGVWEFQQGGIDLGEDTTTTLWRELQEEVGLTKSDIKTVTEMPGWTVYPTEDALTDNDKPRLGQAHKWYFLELKPDVTIDLNKASDKEASDYRFTTFDEMIEIAPPLKKHVYQNLKRYFFEQIA